WPRTSVKAVEKSTTHLISRHKMDAVRRHRPGADALWCDRASSATGDILQVSAALLSGLGVIKKKVPVIRQPITQGSGRNNVLGHLPNLSGSRRQYLVLLRHILCQCQHPLSIGRNSCGLSLAKSHGWRTV